MATAANWLGKASVGVVKVWGLVEGTAGTWFGPGDSLPLELNPVSTMGDKTTGFGLARGLLVAAGMATTRPSRWSSSVSWAAVLPGRSWPKNRATKTVSSVSSVSPLLVTPMDRGAVPNGLRSTVAITFSMDVSMTLRLFDDELAT